MPNLPANFSAYPVTATLDASGNAAVVFQPVGSNIRITNISVRASSTTSQATATIYKNQIGDMYRLSGTNSGSTGDSISTPIDLFDGEKVYVVWTGGDVGAIATATFTGKAIPNSNVGSGEGGVGWTNPIAAGDGTLVYPALKSPNYVAEVSGWKLDRNGSAELNSLLVRAGGIVVRDAPSGKTIVINAGVIGFYPEDTVNVTTYPGSIAVAAVDSATLGLATMEIKSPGVNSLDNAQLKMYSESMLGDIPKIEFTGDVWTKNDLRDYNSNLAYALAETGSINFNLVADTFQTIAIPFTNTFPSIPTVTTNINNGNGLLRGWGSRAINVTTTGFTLFIFSPLTTSTAVTLNPVNVQWSATVG